MARNDKAAKKELKDAYAALDAIAARDKRTGNREETPEYWAANERAARAEKNVSALSRLTAHLGR